MIGLIRRIFSQLKNDKRSLGLMIMAPVMVMSLLYLLLGESQYVPTIGLLETVPEPLAVSIESLESSVIKVVRLTGEDNKDALLIENTLDAVLDFSPEGISIHMLEADSVRIKKINAALSEAFSKGDKSRVMNFHYLYGEDHGSTFDSLAFALLGVMSFFIIFLLSGVSFIRERTTGTLERMMLTPIRRLKVVSGYTIGFGFFGAIQSIVLILYTQYILEMPFVGSTGLAIVVMILLAVSAVATGTLISIFANNEFQVVQFIPVIIIPQIFFSGIIPIDTLPMGLGNLSYAMPIFYGCEALKGIIVKGYGLQEVYPEMGALIIFIIALSLINTAALRKYRRM